MGITYEQAEHLGIAAEHPDHPSRRAAESGTWTLAIPDWHPTRLNVLMRMHWAARGRRLKSEAKLIATYARQANIPAATGKRRVTQRLTLKGRDKERDDDNAWKGVLDHLVKCKLLVDDSRAWVERNPLEFERGTRRMTTIVLEDVPPGPTAETIGRAMGLG